MKRRVGSAVLNFGWNWRNKAVGQPGSEGRPKTPFTADGQTLRLLMTESQFDRKMGDRLELASFDWERWGKGARRDRAEENFASLVAE